ncbi:ATP-dependent nuclease [Cohaesibacter haloalkalitolerans]|uniref:ATP-dependent nuclease n=1 Tax=Cohaesibacter haloalkalitolerans TaxID=1162980 RepID=UPI000E64C57B|nr:ATP-dependent endonuclease [Cohaesibacter haloalkalitolerans]
MYLASLTITNFRRIKSATVEFAPGLNILVGPNNIGKTAVVDALRSLLAGTDAPYPRFSVDDIHLPKGAAAAGDIDFDYVFKDLSLDDEADFLHGLKIDSDGNAEVLIRVTYGNADKSGRLRSRKVCGIHHDIAMTSTMLENLRSVYLQPLRDAELGLRPCRSSQLSRLMHILSDDAGKEQIAEKLKNLDKEIKALKPVVETQAAIIGRHKSMLGDQLAQLLAVELSGSDFTKFASRLSLLVDNFEIERNGLGYNNLIFMAVVLSELAKNADSAYRSLIVEEPEAHLHPQLQAVLLRYLSEIEVAEGEQSVQVFVTSHSPNFASIADLDVVECLVETETGVDVFHPRAVSFAKGKKEKLMRYLDVTRAELFFARRIIFVEGAAELMMIDLLAKKAGYDLRNYGVSLISVEGLNFDSFLPLFGEKAIKVPVAVITDADPVIIDEHGKSHAHYPSATEAITISSNTKDMKTHEDTFVRIFHGQKTFEYDFALHEENRSAMLAALKELHPNIGADLEVEVGSKVDDRQKAEALFSGMFERPKGKKNVQKGAFAQALAAQIDDNHLKIAIPTYIAEAVKHACKP